MIPKKVLPPKPVHFPWQSRFDNEQTSKYRFFWFIDIDSVVLSTGFLKKVTKWENRRIERCHRKAQRDKTLLH